MEKQLSEIIRILRRIEKTISKKTTSQTNMLKHKKAMEKEAMEIAYNEYKKKPKAFDYDLWCKTILPYRTGIVITPLKLEKYIKRKNGL